MVSQTGYRLRRILANRRAEEEGQEEGEGENEDEDQQEGGDEEEGGEEEGEGEGEDSGPLSQIQDKAGGAQQQVGVSITSEVWGTHIG